MKIKSVLSILLVFSLVFSLAACGCEHEWKEATCTETKTCELCDEKIGEPNGHDFESATCTEPETCKICKETRGEVAPHDFTEANCDFPKKCTKCLAEEGKALGHNYGEDGFCKRCNRKDPNYVFLETVGFNERRIMSVWVEIDGYDFEKNCVEIKGYDYLYFIAFSDNYYQEGRISYSTLKSATAISSSMFEKIETTPCSYLSNDVISVRNGAYTITITGRSVTKNNKKLVVKTNHYNGYKLENKNREKWYVPAAILDFTTITKKGDNTYIVKFRK